MANKRCSCCGTTKAISDFYRQTKSKDGHTSQCKICMGARAKARYLTHASQIKRQAIEWAKNNPEKARLKQKKYADTHKAIIAAKMHDRYREPGVKEKKYETTKEWRNKNRRAFLEKKKEWRESNPAKIRMYAQTRRAQKLLAKPPWVNDDEIATIYEEATRLSVDGNKFHVDHIVPLKGPRARSGPFKGERLVCGLHVPWNLQILRQQDNLSKSNKIWPDMP